MADWMDRKASKQRSRREPMGTRALRVLGGVWKHRILILFLMIAAAAAFSWHSVQMNEKKASATLTLGYEQAYEGLNPNGTRFNIYDIMSDAVLETTIDRVGLTGELTADELMSSLTVNASGSQSANNMYIATEYTIALAGDKLPARISARSLLNLLMETYKQFFLENYGTNDSILEIDWSEVGNWDYLDFAYYADAKLSGLINYLNSLRTNSGMAQYRLSGESFRSLSESVADFRSIYLDRFISYVTINHLFRDPVNDRHKMEYQRFQVAQKKKSSENYYAIYQDALAMYDESMITFVMVPMYDSASGLYMARTAIGMDNLTAISETYAGQIESWSQKLKTYDREIQNTNEAEDDAEQHARARQMIAEMQMHLDSLIARIRLAIKDYEDYRSRNLITYVMDSKGLISGYNLKGAACAALTVLALSVTVSAVRTYRKQE